MYALYLLAVLELLLQKSNRIYIAHYFLERYALPHTNGSHNVCVMSKCLYMFW